MQASALIFLFLLSPIKITQLNKLNLLLRLQKVYLPGQKQKRLITVCTFAGHFNGII